MHNICTNTYKYMHFTQGYVAKCFCMYLHVFHCIRMYQCCMLWTIHTCMYICKFVCMCMYPVHISTRAYQFSKCMCKIHVSACIMYVSCMYVCFCMYTVCISYVCVCVACIGPNQHSYGHNLAKRPASGPGTRRPYSGQP